MSLPGQFRQVAVLFAYAAYVLMPLAHGLANAATDCPDGCPYASDPGPSLRVPCDSPCSDTSHHHHHSEHDSDHCAVCQACAAGHVSTLAPSPVCNIASNQIAPCNAADALSDDDYSGLHLIRGPPATR